MMGWTSPWFMLLINGHNIYQMKIILNDNRVVVQAPPPQAFKLH
jgi:hypothetical protein